MLAVMERGTQGAGPSGVAGSSSSPSDPPIQEFLSSGRTGRRNALPDILGTYSNSIGQFDSFCRFIERINVTMT